MDRQGIAVAGNILVDNVKRVRGYPAPGMLADIVDARRAVGGCVPNTAIDLAVLGGCEVLALGKVGADEAAAYVLSELEKHGVDVSRVRKTSAAQTSFSDAMCALDTGERTFFHYRGANALFCPEDIDLDDLNCRMLHIGYVLLLDAFDAPDAKFGTVMARFLRDAQARGIRTSIDAVSDGGGRFREVVAPALRYCDYAIMNEIEGCAAAGLAPRDASGRLIRENVARALAVFLESGVSRMAVIHCPEGGFALERGGWFTSSPSLLLGKDEIKGSVGAGDAFCAGCLHGLYAGWDTRETLDFAAAAAAASLSEADSVSGMLPEKELLRMMRERERRTL